MRTGDNALNNKEFEELLSATTKLDSPRDIEQNLLY